MRKELDPIVLEAVKMGVGFFIATSGSGCDYLVSRRAGVYLVESPIITNGLNFLISLTTPHEPICCEDAFKKMKGSFVLHINAWKRAIS